jgi:prepilin-type processing-associated H-X9-DG protein
MPDARRYRIQRKTTDARNASLVFIFGEIHPKSICRPMFGMNMDAQTIYYYPGNYHGTRSNFSFVDGHAETHRWKDSQFNNPLPEPTNWYDHTGNPVRSSSQGDLVWLKEHAASRHVNRRLLSGFLRAAEHSGRWGTSHEGAEESPAGLPRKWISLFWHEAVVGGHSGVAASPWGGPRVEGSLRLERENRLASAQVGQSLNAHVARAGGEQHDIARGDPGQAGIKVSLFHNDQLAAQGLYAAGFELPRIREGCRVWCQDHFDMSDAPYHKAGAVDQAHHFDVRFQGRTMSLLDRRPN